MKKKTHLWVARETEENHRNNEDNPPGYLVSILKPFLNDGWEFPRDLGTWICHAAGRRLFAGLRLKPGEGPVKVSITLETE
jgi:hypothetical protein